MNKEKEKNDIYTSAEKEALKSNSFSSSGSMIHNGDYVAIMFALCIYRHVQLG